ncbi:MAG: DNA-protecting protein DprA [Bacteroidetes bacterium]|nr:DNA-protecting protein DprA [Bacteroidota bacterium]
MRSDDEQLMLQIALHLLPGIGPVLARNLVSYCGSVEEVFRKKKFHLEKIPGIGSERAEMIVKHKLFDQAKEEVKWIRNHGIRPYFFLDKDYPARLKNCDDAPALLFAKGEMDLNAERIIAIVGTRHITTHGKDATEKLVSELAEFNPVVISGLAYGVDITAHMAAVKAGLPTIGVVAHGLDKVYPTEHIKAVERMFPNGGLLSEYIHGVKPDKEHFPMRNRIVAGLCDAVIVIESAKRGGALITAEIANSYNRDVFAMPGRVTDSFSAGCHELIRQNKATIFTNAAHIADAMNWNVSAPEKKKTKQLVLFNELSPDEKKLVTILQNQSQSTLDEIAITCDLPVSKVSTLLLKLEFDGVVRALPGKVFLLQ